MEHPSIMLHSGEYFDFVNPEVSKFTIHDIAHALSHICRFAGHCDTFYSVAQHSVMASRIAPIEDAMAALLHDAPEFVLGDVSRPLKSLLPDYKALERRISKVVLNRFGVDENLPESVKRADMILLATERRDMLPRRDDEWYCLRDVTPLDETIYPWPPLRAEEEFKWRYKQLGGTL